MYKTFDEMINNCGCLSGSSLVAAAADRETIEAVKMAFDKGLGHAVFTGDEKIIAPVMSWASRARLRSSTPAVRRRRRKGPLRSFARAAATP